jgi:hypothetical protein
VKRALVPLALALLLLGCGKDPYGDSVKAGNAIAQGIGQAMKTIVTTQANGLITPTEELNVLGYLKFANDADGAFLICANQVHQGVPIAAASYTACASTFLASLNTPGELALLHISNPQAQKDVTVIANGIATAVNSIITALGGQ